jgi:hypothetical protein
MSLITDIEKLRGLEQQATCAPWYKAERDEGDCDEINGRIQSWDTSVLVYDHEMGVFHPEKVKIRYGPEEFEDDYDMESICAPDKERNAEFIAVSRNLAPAMLDILGMIREGDAEDLSCVAEFFKADCELEGDRIAAVIRRYEKMAALMEKEEQ